VKFDHIGVVVADMSEGRRLLSAMFRIEGWTEVFDDAEIGVYVQFGIGTDGPCYELIAPRSEDSPVSRTLKAMKNILNHVAYLVDDLDSTAGELRARGCVPVADPQPAAAYDGNRVQFFMSPLRFMIEIIEAPEHRHSFHAIQTH
jgi:methylmalonyl-CoA/ethylmalonyl-CoA epimerase